MYEDRLNVYSKTNEIIPLSSWQACTKCEKFAISTEIFFIPSFFITKKYEREIYDPLNANVKNVETFGDGKMMVVMNGENFLEKLNDIQFFILLNNDGNLLIDDFTINSKRDWFISGDETNKFTSYRIS